MKRNSKYHFESGRVMIMQMDEKSKPQQFRKGDDEMFNVLYWLHAIQHLTPNDSESVGMAKDVNACM